MPSCAVITCKARSQASSVAKGRISFHRFPTKPDLRKQWTEITGRKNWIPTKSSTICSQHFNEDDYAVKKSGNKYLKDGAVPHENVVYIVTDTKISTLSSRQQPQKNIDYQIINKRAKNQDTVDPVPSTSTVSVEWYNQPIKKRDGSSTDVSPPRRVPEDSRSVTPITDPEDEETEMEIQVKEEKDYTIVIQDPLSQGARGSFKQLHSHQPGAGHSQLYVQPSTSTSELVIKEEIDEEFLDYKAMYYKLLDEVQALRNQQLHQEHQALLETNKSLGTEMENLIATNQKHVSDMQQLMSENQKLTEKNQSLVENIQLLSDKIQALTEKSDEYRTKDRVDIFSDYIEKIANLNEKIRNLTEENKSLTERINSLTEKNKTLAESVRKYSEESRSLKMKDKLQRKFIQRLNNSFNSKLDAKSKVIKALRQNLIKIRAGYKS